MAETHAHIDVPYVAHLARLKLSPEETARFQTQLDDIVDYIKKLQEADLTKVPETNAGQAWQNNLREDQVTPSLDVKKVTSNAPQSSQNLIMAPKIVEG